MPSSHLDTLGWTDWFASHFEPFAGRGCVPARVAVRHSRLVDLYTDEGEVLGVLAGRLLHKATAPHELPVVGDWVAVRKGAGGSRPRIEAVLPRRTKFSRRMAGDQQQEQVVAANIDVVLLVSGLDLEFNPRRIERYLVLARESGARPVIVLNKADLSVDLAAQLAEVAAVAGEVSIHPVSSLTGAGLDEIRTYLTPGRTLALLGSSGVGKSTLVNRLVGEARMATREVRATDHRGRHTTTQRELIVVPEGGLVIDTPGLRELQLWEGDEGLQESFDDLEALAEGCRFRDCRHRDEPDCALKAAVADGRLAAGRLASYLKLQAELARQAEQGDRLAQRAAKRRVKSLVKQADRYKPRE